MITNKYDQEKKNRQDYEMTAFKRRPEKAYSMVDV